MSTDTRTPALRTSLLLGLLILGGLLGGWLLLRGNTPGNMAGGFLGGGLAALGAFAVVVLRLRTSPQSASTFERAWTQTGDERDDSVLTRALAVLGLLALPLSGLAVIGVGLGLDPAMVGALLILGQVLVLAVTFVVIERRS